MKTPALLLLAIMSTAFVTNAQTTRIHFFRTTRAATISTDLFPVQLQGKPLNIPFRKHVVIETQSDSVGFVTDKTIGYIKFPKGKDYYFTVRYNFGAYPNSFTAPDGIVEEVSEQNFKLAILFNRASLNPEVIYKAED